MVISVLTSLAIAIVIVFLWGWLGDWSQTRFRRESAAYWARYDLTCPNCRTRYPRDENTNEWTTFCGESNTGRSLSCPTCNEQADFRRTEEAPEFMAYLHQPRRCLECSELFNGVPDSACPVCSTVRHVLADKAE